MIMKGLFGTGPAGVLPCFAVFRYHGVLIIQVTCETVADQQQPRGG